MSRPPPRILICYLVRNSGHHAAARAIEAEIRKQSPHAEIRCLDLLETTHPTWSALVQYAYMSTIRRTPELWEALYDNFWFDWLTKWIRPLVQRGNSLKLRILMDAFQPDAMVCTQAHPFAVLSAYARRQGQPIPLWGVVTDFLPHRFWFVPPNEHIRYVVPTETAVQRLMILGIPGERIHTFGIPIQADQPADRKRPTRLDRRRVLVMGGSRGLGARFATIRHLDRATSDFTIDVVTGTNRRLRKQLLGARHKFKHPMRIRGYVRNVAAMMRHSSLLIGKPGGLTSAEAMVAGTPMLIIRPLPGQERGNTEMLVRHGAAIHLDRDRDLPAVVTSLLTNPTLLDMMAARARALGKPDAARDIANAVLAHIPPEAAPAP
ncbi:MAG TPA: glycosyltransferase [Kiritimatiellia bacterium]|nr:glycosyltransferase [Kiritimatiellia bacterium]HXK79633.1 glycosyltransferase [Kiritimatiellia bacterium]